jgi:predicted DNA binding protein
MFIATFSIEPQGFALAYALDEVPEIAVEAERIAAHSTSWVMPCLWAAGGDFDAFDAALEADSTVEEVVEATDVGDEKYYQLEWSDDVIQHVDAAIDKEASILNAEAENGEWHLRVRFVSREQFEAFRDYLADQGLTFRLQNLTESTTPRQEMGGLTDAQRDALVAAVKAGYFAIPRNATMADVADGLGISEQAASERLRRGIDHLVKTILITASE